MPKNRKISTLDGYATIKAVARAKPEKPAKPAEKPADRADEPVHITSEPADLQKIGARVARTVMPVKHVIECYECGYKFQLHGRADKTNCSKCRVTLDLTDRTIDGEWNKTLKTTGTIRLSASGILKGGELIASDVVLEGIVEGGTVRAMRRLELAEGALFPEKAISASDLLIGAGATFTFKHETKYRDIEVVGHLKGKFVSTGVVTIKPGGLLEGDLRAQHLVVEDGGGLKANLQISPASAAT